MDDFTLYSREDENGNGLLDDIVNSDIGDHGMFVTGITNDGNLIVSSWGNEYIVKPKAISLYKILSDTVSNIFSEKEQNSLTAITIYDYSEVKIVAAPW